MIDKERNVSDDDFEALTNQEKIGRARKEWRRDHAGLIAVLILVPALVLAAGVIIMNKLVIAVGGIAVFVAYIIKSDSEMSYLEKRCFSIEKEKKAD